MQTLRNKSKYKGLKRIYYSAKYSIDGLLYAYGHEKSLWIHAVLVGLTVLFGIVLNISINQWIVMLISLGVILAFELVNTAMEACVDMVTVEFNELAKIAKDCCSAATFVTSIIGTIIALVIFVPKFLELFGLI